MDLIDRQAAIDAIDETNWYHQNENKDMVSGANSADHQPWFKSDDVYSALKSVPSAPRWIPCKERLPEEMGDYLVCDNCQNIYVNEWITTTTTWSWHYDDGRITAWMPLPEPYKE